MELSGKTFSQYDSTANDREQDLFIITRDDGDTLSSYSATYETLINHIMNRMMELGQFGSMAYEDKKSYSKKDHKHPYTSVEYTSLSSYDKELATFVEIYGDNRVFSKMSRQEFVQKPLICPRTGELRLCYSDLYLNSELSDINDEEFDGWFVANGKTFSRSEIENKRLLETWDDNPFVQSNTLTIPILSDFVNVENRKYEDYSDIIQSKTYFPEHTHKISELSGHSNLSVVKEESYINSYYASGSDAILAGKNSKSDTETVSIPHSFFYKWYYTNLSVTLSGGEQDCENYPSHYQIPTLIYIFKN